MAEEKKKKKGMSGIIVLLLLAVIGYVVGFCIVYFTGENVEIVDALTSTYAFIGLGVGVAAALIYLFMKWSKKPEDKTKGKTVGKTAEGVEMDLSYNAKMLGPDDIAKSVYGSINTTWAQLPNVNKTGIVFQNSLRNGKYNISMKDEYHAMVIGATASGKSHLMVIPTIRILGHSGEKPDMVISDPKGELYQLTSNILKEEGYRVYKYDLRDPFSSSRWNPMQHAYDVYQEALNCKNNVKKCTNGASPERSGFKPIPGEKYGKEWYGFNGIAYPDLEQLKVAIRSTEEVLKDQAYGELKDVVATICPKSNAPDPTWEEGAKDFLYGVTLAMLEDSENPELGMTRDKFNFYNLYKIAMYKDPDPDNPFETLKKYLLQGRDERKSEVPQLTANVVNTSPNTAKSYFSVLSGKVSFMQDVGISYLTSESDLDFSTFTDKPTVLYIVIPDDKEERYGLANICISQLYKRLVDKTNTLVSKKLPRHCYFILDEFGNLPPIPKFDSMITVSRSRNILYELAIQSYTQLETKYGKDAAETIKANCNAQIFIGTDDQNTREDFSKRCGEVQLIYEETSESKSKGEKQDQSSTSKSTQIQRATRPLITAYELGQLPFGTVIAKLYRSQPVKVELTPDFKTPFFHRNDANPEVGIMKSLDREKVYYDIKARNKKLLKPSNPFDF